MKPNRTCIVFATAALFTGAAIAQENEPPVAVNTDGMALHVAAKVKEKAAEGVTALRRYVYITRAQHNLDMRTITRVEKD
jgi:hypothetical protein